MPRARLSLDAVVLAGAQLADEAGYRNVTLALVAERLGVRTPSLYKHVDGLADLQHRIATLAMRELGEAMRDAMLGLAGPDALAALARAMRGYVTAHPGRYTATIGATDTGPDDPLTVAGARVIDTISAVLRGYGIVAAEMTHAIRTLRSTLHGFAVLQAGNGFQWGDDAEETFDWLIGFIDRGLRAPGRRPSAEPAEPGSANGHPSGPRLG